MEPSISQFTTLASFQTAVITPAYVAKQHKRAFICVSEQGSVLANVFWTQNNKSVSPSSPVASARNAVAPQRSTVASSEKWRVAFVTRSSILFIWMLNEGNKVPVDRYDLGEKRSCSMHWDRRQRRFKNQLSVLSFKTLRDGCHFFSLILLFNPGNLQAGGERSHRWRFITHFNAPLLQ